MALLTDDCDINNNRLITYVGGNGDYYIEIIGDDDRSLAVRIAMSGGIAPLEVKLAAVAFYRAMEKTGLNERNNTPMVR